VGKYPYNKQLSFSFIVEVEPFTGRIDRRFFDFPVKGFVQLTQPGKIFMGSPIPPRHHFIVSGVNSAR
jgi:hypothetical protein